MTELQDFNSVVAGLNLNAHVLDDVWEKYFGNDDENIDSVLDDVWVVPNVECVTEQLKKSTVLRRGTNWIAVRLEYDSEAGDEQKQIYDYLDENYTSLHTGYGITIDEYRK